MNLTTTSLSCTYRQSQPFVLCSPVEKLQETLKRFASCVTDQVILLNDDSAKKTSLIFLRDSAVNSCAKDKKWLIPHSPQNSSVFQTELTKVVQAVSRRILISHQNPSHFKQNNGQSGKGYDFNAAIQLMRVANQYKIPYIRGSTRIEGGNILHFKDENGVGVVIGEESLYMSWLALKEQNAFQNLKKEKTEKENGQKEASDQVFRIACNQTLWPYEKKMPDCKVTHQDKLLYKEKATSIEAELELTKKQMAKELQLDLNRLIFVPQVFFHLDMEAFAIDDTVYLHDPKLTEKLLEELKNSRTLSCEALNYCCEYLEDAARQKEAFAALRKERSKILKAHRIRYVKLPAVVRSEGLRSELNLCNGFVLKKWQKTNITAEAQQNYFITNGASTNGEREILEKMVDAIKRRLSHVDLVCVEGMSSQLFEFSAGLHCMSIEI